MAFVRNITTIGTMRLSSELEKYKETIYSHDFILRSHTFLKIA